MTRKEVRDLAKAQMGIGSGSDALINKFINDTGRWVSTNLKHLQGRSTVTLSSTTDTAGAALEADFLEWKSGRIGSEFFYIVPREGLVPDLDDRLKENHYGYIWNGKIYNKTSYAEDQTLDYDYYAIYTDITSDGNSVIDREYEDLFMADLCARIARWIGRDSDMYASCINEREYELRRARSLREMQEHQPKQVSYQWP